MSFHPRENRRPARARLAAASLGLILLFTALLQAAELSPGAAISGDWAIDEKLSDDTDKRVEKAIKAGGGKISRGKKVKGRYRGGPPSQQLYDHVSYDEVLSISYQDPVFRLEYEDGYTRVFYTDGRRQVYSASGGSDYSFAGWEDGVLYVESKPLDQGSMLEIFTLDAHKQQLQVKIIAHPSSFTVPIEITRVYNRR